MTKTALITGGSRGIGRATAELLRAREWEVTTPTRRELDFTDPETITFYERQNMKHGIPFIDAIIFCHGEWYSKAIDDKSRYPIDWYRQFSMRLVWPAEFMEFFLLGNELSRPKCVIMVSSTRGFIGGADTGPYAVACAAQIALMQGYAREYGTGVRFNVVCPGLTDTDMGDEVIAAGGAKPGAAMQPAEAVAAEIVRLIESDDNGKVVRVVDGKADEMVWGKLIKE